MNALCFDIETIALPEGEIRAKLPPFDESKVALGNAKLPDTVSRIIEEARSTHGDLAVSTGALSPEYGRIAIAGALTEGDKPYSFYNEDERLILESAWHLVDSSIRDTYLIVGFNIKGFDLPFMVKRSWILGVSVPQSIYSPRKSKYPWPENIIDLMDVWKCGDYKAPWISFNQLCRNLGIPIKDGEGSKFGELWERNKTAALKYNSDELLVLSQVAERMIG